MQMHGYEVALLAAAFLLELGVVYRIVTAKLTKEYPSLLRFLIANLIAMAATPFFVRFATQDVYDYFYWFCDLTIDCMALAVVMEIFLDVFKPYEALRKFGTLMFRWVVAVLVLVSVASTVSAGRLHAAELLNTGCVMFDRGLMMLQCGVVLFLLLTNKYLGISYRSRVFGISLGFGVIAAVSLLVWSTLHWVSHDMVSPLFGLMNLAARIGDFIWLVYFFLPQPERRLSDVMPESRRWEYALASIQAPAPEGLFLTSIDRTVERLLTKNNVATGSKSKEDKHWFGD
jgi:hypothetical protein